MQHAERAVAREKALQAERASEAQAILARQQAVQAASAQRSRKLGTKDAKRLELERLQSEFEECEARWKR